MQEIKNLKYNIRYYLQLRGKSRDGERLLRQEIRKKCNNLSAAQLSAWENYTNSSKNMIPADHLLSISKILKVDINQLFNQTPGQVPNPL